MSRDLTDHVRERDESEGPPMKPITDAQAKKMFAIARKREYDGKVTEHMPLEACAGTVLRLLADRTVAMEIIKEARHLLLSVKSDNPDIQRRINKIFKKAHALIAAAKGGE